jgi:hypothetical protein
LRSLARPWVRIEGWPIENIVGFGSRALPGASNEFGSRRGQYHPIRLSGYSRGLSCRQKGSLQPSMSAEGAGQGPNGVDGRPKRHPGATIGRNRHHPRVHRTERALRCSKPAGFVPEPCTKRL